jgi:striatin 1/3/4
MYPESSYPPSQNHNGPNQQAQRFQHMQQQQQHQPQQQQQQQQQAAGGPSNQNAGSNADAQSATNSNPVGGSEMNLAGVLHYLQSEWRRWERDRNEWEIERAEMRVGY